LIGKSDFDEISFKMQVISVAFRLGKVGFWEMETELLGMPESGKNQVHFFKG
jgi:hypothetical protein